MSVKDIHQFEKGRIKALQDERVYIQKKTFTKWANAFLEKVKFLNWRRYWKIISQQV